MKRIFTHCILLLTLSNYSCQTEDVKPLIAESITSDATEALPVDLKLLTPNRKESTNEVTISIQNNVADTVTYEYEATVVPVDKGYYVELGKGTIKLDKSGRPVNLLFKSSLLLTRKDGFYITLYHRGIYVGYYRINEYYGV